MVEVLRATAGRATAVAEPEFHRWKIASEPLWFAIFCREAWGTNAPKELEFLFGDRWTDRSYRAWSAGDNEPAPRVLPMLVHSPIGGALVDYINRDAPPKWWADVVEDRRQAAILRAAMRDVARSE